MSSKLFQSITRCIESRKLNQSFRVQDVNRCCNNLLSKSPSFLSKHRVGNPGGYTEYFVRERDVNGEETQGLYRVIS